MTVTYGNTPAHETPLVSNEDGLRTFQIDTEDWLAFSTAAGGAYTIQAFLEYITGLSSSEISPMHFDRIEIMGDSGRTLAQHLTYTLPVTPATLKVGKVFEVVNMVGGSTAAKISDDDKTVVLTISAGYGPGGIAAGTTHDVITIAAVETGCRLRWDGANWQILAAATTS